MSFFLSNLKRMDFDVSSGEHRSLLLVSEKNEQDLSPNEVFALEDADKKFNATAVYFRHFPKSENRPPIPQIYIYDNTQNEFSDNLADIHRDLWSNSQIPMFIVIEKTEVKIFDTRKPVEVSGQTIETNPIDTIPISADAIRHYSRKLFDSGIFWETEKAKGHFLESTSAYKDLIDGLKRIRDKFLEDVNLPPQIAHKILVFAILIKYLEERGNEDEKLFAENFFQEFGAKNFCDVLRQKGKIVELFAKLSQHFNGRIFEWENSEEKHLVAETDLSELADFLDADIDENKQLILWRKYSFNRLPVELISTVYETFLTDKKDAVYTPEFLVNALLDEAMPLSDYEQTSFKTIDVSCGSGIFLVGAFKRLAQRHRYLQFKKTGKLLPANPDVLLKIIKDNTFGVDIEDESVRLTIFSLCLALCDELTPMQIWTELKFDETFQTNFIAENFFKFLNKAEKGSWDLVIGNPPFKELSPNKEEYQEIVEVNPEIKQRSKERIYPQNQLALMFLDQVPHLLKENGLVCLILPAAPLLYNNSPEFRKHFFPKYQVSQVFDFTVLDIFRKRNPQTQKITGNVPTIALFARKNSSYNEKLPIEHIIFRKTRTVEQRIFLEVDKYDVHQISQSDALHNKSIWKSNLLGGGRLDNLINRLSELNSIKNFVDKKEWIANEGYIVGSVNDKTRKPADYIHLKPTLPTKAFKENGVDESQITPETSSLFHTTGDKRIYSPPHLLIKEIIGTNKIPTYFTDRYLTFKHRIVGINAPVDDREQLLELSKAFEIYSDIYRFFITTTSNEYLVGRATTILKQDIMNLPYPEDKEELNLSFVEQILCDDVLEYYTDLLSKGSKSKTNKNAEENQLKQFGKVFTKALNSIYEQNNKHFYLKKIYDWQEYCMTEFGYGEKSDFEGIEKGSEIDEEIKSLVEAKYGESVYLIKVVKIYQKNKVLLLKPKSLRFWLRSIAIKDADEVLSDLVKAGY
ncbi:MAG: Eco57I restriction-modification methylase domain-containing protein [Pyrinomonadaceae bacterium]